MLITAPFPYHIDEDIKYRNPTCVFKLVFGSKYFIFKGLKIAKTVEGLAAQIHKEIGNQKESSILYKVVAYVIKSRVTVMKVEVIFETDAIIDLLFKEYEALREASKDPNCLNTRFINNEYFPAWVPQSAVNEFNRRLQGAKPTDTDNNLKRFLKRLMVQNEATDKIIAYVKKNYKPGNRYNVK